MAKTNRKETTTKAPVKPKREKGFWGVTRNSRKEQIATILDKHGKSAAIDQGNALGLSKATVTSWIRTWTKAGLVAAEPKTSPNRKAKTVAKAVSDERSTA